MSSMIYCENCSDLFWTYNNANRYCSLECKFKSKFIKKNVDECWLWTGSIFGRGYGQFKFKGEEFKAHRFSYEFHNNKKIANGMHILHSCHNPPCVNYNHLREGSVLDNVKDMKDAGRQVTASKIGILHPGAILTEEDVKQIKIRLVEGVSKEKLSYDFGVTTSAISGIISCNNWTHILPGFLEKNYVLEYPQRGIRHTEETIKDIKDLLRKGYNKAEISSMVGVTDVYVGMISRDKIKKWVNVS